LLLSRNTGAMLVNVQPVETSQANSFDWCCLLSRYHWFMIVLLSLVFLCLLFLCLLFLLLL